MQNREYLYYIDKTESLEKGIRRFPSIYIEGNAASGKSTAVTMFLKAHSEMPSCIFDFKDELKDCKKLLGKLSVIKERLQNENIWVVIENIPEHIDADIAEALSEAVNKISNDSCFIFVSREKPQKEFLELLWKNKMEIIPMEKLLFTEEEVRIISQQMGAGLDAVSVHAKTGGWPGCVRMLLYLSKINGNTTTIEELLNIYEMKSYVQNEMLSVLSDEEKSLLSHIAGCPWVNKKLAEEVWDIENVREKLDTLQRKGFLVFEGERQRWKIAPLLQRYISERLPVIGAENVWYENSGYIAEALWCVKKSGTVALYHEYMLKYYDKVYALGLISGDVLKWRDKTPQDCYLRGAYYYSVQKFEELGREISNLEKIKYKDLRTKEILLNLYYLNPQTSLVEWLHMLEEMHEGGKKFRMYHLLGNSVTYLCGLRDLSGLFACSKKEEKQKARLWKSAFGEVEWKCYQLARIDYCLDTGRENVLTEEEWSLLQEKVSMQELWQIRMAKLYLLCKLQRIQPEEMRIPRINELENSLYKENNPICAETAECIGKLYAPWCGAREKTAKWLRYTVMESTMAITEENYLMFYCHAKGYLFLNQFEHAEKILKKLVPYLQSYHRYRFLTEVFFQYAIVNWEKDLKGLAVKNAIESFLISISSRYVKFYMGYGARGRQVLEAYVEWQKNNAPEGWNHKKKYNYGDVLRMPVEDYLEVILRGAKKPGNMVWEEYIKERLTMMETIVLHDIGRGMSNAEICEELGLKLPTVKGHVYSIFKKLGVSSRVQAVVKGKELGVLE